MSKRKTSSPDALAADLLWGVDGKDGIAAFIGVDVRKCYYLISRGEIPTKKLGHRTITASRRELRRLFAQETA
jgi:hypothetical protein